jgi:hypothetical protein
MITNFKLFIYEELDNSIRKYYWMQINDENNWIPLTDKLYNDIMEEGWIDDLEYVYKNINKNDIVYKELILIDEDKSGLIEFDDDIINNFNEFDIEIKDKQKYPFNMIDMIDYENGKVYILKYNSEQNDK